MAGGWRAEKQKRIREKSSESQSISIGDQKEYETVFVKEDKKITINRKMPFAYEFANFDSFGSLA